MEGIDTNEIIEVIQQILENNNASTIEKLIPIISMIVVALVSILTIILTNRANRNLSVYNRKKNEIKSFSKVCGKYFGIISILAAAMKGKEKLPKFSRYTNSVIQTLSKCKWEILSYIDPSKTEEIYAKMAKLEYLSEELRKAVIVDECLEESNNPSSDEIQEKHRNHISSVIKPNIQIETQELQKLLIEQKQIMSKNLDCFKYKN